jgi:hypothetical protein
VQSSKSKKIEKYSLPPQFRDASNGVSPRTAFLERLEIELRERALRYSRVSTSAKVREVAAAMSDGRLSGLTIGHVRDWPVTSGKTMPSEHRAHPRKSSSLQYFYQCVANKPVRAEAQLNGVQWGSLSGWDLSDGLVYPVMRPSIYVPSFALAVRLLSS